MVSNKMFECDKYKKLYLEEKKKVEELERRLQEMSELLTTSLEVLSSVKKEVKSEK